MRNISATCSSTSYPLTMNVLKIPSFCLAMSASEKFKSHGVTQELKGCPRSIASWSALRAGRAGDRAGEGRVLTGVVK